MSGDDTTEAPNNGTLGQYLARRLVEIGVRDVFSVPGDANLTLLDHFVAEPELNLVGCCNELNAGYAADGYARAKGVGACVVTFTVGGLSLINAIAGAYSEGLPVICIVGGPHSMDFGSGRILHHTTGLSSDFDQELRCFQNVTCAQAVVRSLDGAQELVDNAILMALKERKPVYISICCNLPGITNATFAKEPIPYFISPERLSNQMSTEEAIEATAIFLNKAVKPVIICGSMLRMAEEKKALIELIDASGYAVAVMPSSKGLVPELHPNFIGTYWGAISSEYCEEFVEAADAYVVVSPGFNDLSTLGYTSAIKEERAVMVQTNSVSVGNGPSFNKVSMTNFMSSLAKKLNKNTTAIENNCRRRRTDIHPSLPLKEGSSSNEPLKVSVLFKRIQDMLSGDFTVIAETGDSWFNCQKLRLPENCGFEVQLQYASIGWSVGATLGYAQGAKDKRLITCIGDGSFQMAAQEVSTMIRCGQNNIMFLLNNGGYTTEAKIHDGPYNVIKNWDYAKLVDAIHNGEGKCWTAKVGRKDELIKATAAATGAKKDCLCFIEVLPRDDSSREVVEFGARLFAANAARSRPH